MSSHSPYLIATCGFPNYGDEVITKGWLKYLADTQPDVPVWVDCPEPGLSAKLFDGIHPQARFTNTVWRMAAEAPEGDPAQLREHVERLVRQGGSPRFDLGLETLREATSVHILGGGYIHALWPRHVALIYAAQAAREAGGAKLYATGLGATPTLGEEYGVAEVLRSFEHLSVRDQASADYLGIDVGLDDAFLMVPEILKQSRAMNLEHTAPDVLVCIQDDMGATDMIESVRRQVREEVQKAVDQGQSVGYVECIPGIDHPGYAALEDLIPQQNFVPFAQVFKDGLPVRNGQRILTTRFHLHLVGAAAGATGTAYGISDDYYDVKHGSLLELGSGWEFVPASGAVQESSSGTMRSQLPSFQERKAAEAASLYGPRDGSAGESSGAAGSLGASSGSAGTSGGPRTSGASAGSGTSGASGASGSATASSTPTSSSTSGTSGADKARPLTGSLRRLLRNK